MGITTDDILVTVLAGSPPTPALKEWLKQWPAENVLMPQPYDELGTIIGDMICGWRNSIVIDFLDNYHHPYLMMIDADAWPVPGSEKIIYHEAPICGCYCLTKKGEPAHPSEGTIPLHCIKVSREALLAIQQAPVFDPAKGWFAIETHKRGTRFRICECQYFSYLAEQAGFQPVKVAPMGHLVSMVITPTETGEVRTEFPAALLGDENDTESDSSHLAESPAAE